MSVRFKMDSERLTDRKKMATHILSLLSYFLPTSLSRAKRHKLNKKMTNWKELKTTCFKLSWDEILLTMNRYLLSRFSVFRFLSRHQYSRDTKKIGTVPTMIDFFRMHIHNVTFEFQGALWALILTWIMEKRRVEGCLDKQRNDAT